jgi:hypothetical protein
MRTLEFTGIVCSNTGKFAVDMVLPGRDDLTLAPADWPKKLVPGTLNIDVNDDGFPKGFDEIGNGEGLSRLDDGRFRPALVIPERKITGDTLKADPDHPRRGTAGVWQAELRVIASGRARPCWLLRRIGSEITSQIELVAQGHLRSCLNLCDGTAVTVTV